jgi:hypothetical protein
MDDLGMGPARAFVPLEADHPPHEIPDVARTRLRLRRTAVSLRR